MTSVVESAARATPSYQNYQNYQVVQAHQALLCEALHQLPQQLTFTPVKGKRPYLPEWQHLSLTRGQIEHQILANDATGYGLLTGNGLLAIDIDGTLADAKLIEISEGELPRTPAWTSGKAGCSQRLYQLSEPIQRVLEATGFTRQFIDCGEGQQLDFRYNGCQSVLPPSQHPETERYQWIVSFSDCEIAPAPTWLEVLLVEWAIASRPRPIARTVRESQTVKPIGHSLTQTWGDRTAPGRIPTNEGLTIRWNNLRITGKGQTNNVLLEFCRLLKESGIDCETAIAEFRHFAPQMPGYQQYASRTSRRDLENGTWAERIVLNWFKRDGYSGHLAKRDSDLNQRRENSALKRISEAITAGFEQALKTVSDWVKWIQAYCYRKWGIKPGLKTLYKYVELWHPKHRNLPADSDHRVELLSGVKELDTSRDTEFSHPPKPHPKLILATWQAIATIHTIHQQEISPNEEIRVDASGSREQPDHSLGEGTDAKAQSDTGSGSGNRARRSCGLAEGDSRNQRRINLGSSDDRAATELSEEVSSVDNDGGRDGAVWHRGNGFGGFPQNGSARQYRPNSDSRGPQDNKAPQRVPVAFKKGDRVIVNDQTGLPYCGKECTITAVLPDGTYRLDINYQGKRLRLRKRKNAVEALPSFLTPVEPPQTPELQVTEVWVSGADIERHGLKGAHFLLDAIGGVAPQRIRPHEVPKNIWKALVSLECREGNVNRYVDIPSSPTHQSASV